MRQPMKALAAAALGCAACAGAYAHEPASAPPALLGGVVQERDVDLVFEYLRDALDGALEGREVTPPAELARRGEAVADELKRRGADAARGLIDRVEALVREGMREPPRRAAPPLPPDRIRI